MPEEPKKVYVPPTDEQVQQYALNVCKTIRKNKEDDYFYKQEFISGFTKFMNHVVTIQTKHLNPKQEDIDEAQQEKNR